MCSFIFTSHGMPPFPALIDHETDDEERKIKQKLLDQYPVLDNYHFIVDGIDERPASFGERLQASKEQQDLFLTPDVLKEMLDEWPMERRKYVVIQSCFAGGFIAKNGGSTNLRSADNVAVLAASSERRPSFGCAPDSKYTFFGGAMIEALKNDKSPATIFSTDFYELFKSTRKKVEKLEADLNELPSLPQFFTNIAR